MTTPRLPDLGLEHVTVLRSLWVHGSLKRADIAEMNHWSRNTAGARLDELEGTGWVVSDSVQIGRGRPAGRWSLDRAAGCFFAVSFGGSHMTAALTDLSGECLIVDSVRFGVEEGVEASINAARVLKLELLRRLKAPLDFVVAAGVAIPSPVDSVTGRPVNPSAMPGWMRSEIAVEFESALGVPTAVDNDANVMALGALRDPTVGSGDLVVLKVSRGIGLGVISGGRLLKGHRGLAGEIGHLPVTGYADRLCDCGNYGCIAVVASSPTIVAELARAGLDVSDSRAVMTLASRGNPTVLGRLRKAGRSIGEVLIPLTAALSPSMVLVTGVLAQGDYLASGIREVVFGRPIPGLSAHLRIESADDSRLLEVRGCAQMAFEALLRTKRRDR